MRTFRTKIRRTVQSLNTPYYRAITHKWQRHIPRHCFNVIQHYIPKVSTKVTSLLRAADSNYTSCILKILDLY